MSSSLFFHWWWRICLKHFLSLCSCYCFIYFYLSLDLGFLWYVASIREKWIKIEHIGLYGRGSCWASGWHEGWGRRFSNLSSHFCRGEGTSILFSRGQTSGIMLLVPLLTSQSSSCGESDYLVAEMTRVWHPLVPGCACSLLGKVNGLKAHLRFPPSSHLTVS